MTNPSEGNLEDVNPEGENNTFQGSEETFVTLERPLRLEINSSDIIRPSMGREHIPKSNFILVWGRIFQITVYWSFYFMHQFLDRILIRDKEKRILRKAKRLRKSFEKMGNGFIKFGQQLSMRMDILPSNITDELAKLLDSSPPFDIKYTIQTIERQTGSPLEKTFKYFDPEPVGSASIACVYQAILVSGERVAVKVRRPGILKKFVTDLDAIDLVMKVVEFFTLIRPGVTLFIRKELRTIMLEELDFKAEKRYQELFRDYHLKKKKLKITAPIVYHHLCGTEIIVSEFVTGIWLQDIIMAIENHDEAGLAYIKSQKINPKKLAKQLVQGSLFGIFECPFFHGDPHPGNILIQPNNQIVLVDFGACGAFSQKDRNLLAQMHYYYSIQNVRGMVQSVIQLAEPLPPLNVEQLTLELEQVWRHGWYGIQSKHSEWWERTSFRLWYGMMGVLRNYDLPLPMNMLRMIRATLLYDTIAARLYPKIDPFEEYKRFHTKNAENAKCRVQKAMAEGLFFGPEPEAYMQIENMWKMGTTGLFRLQQLLQYPTPRFAPMVGKVYDLFTVGLYWFRSTLVWTLICLIILATIRLTETGDPQTVFTTGLIQESPRPIFILWGVVSILLSIVFMRRFLFRLGDKDIK